MSETSPRGPGESERRSGSPGCVGSADRLLGLALHGVLKLRARRYARRRRELVRSWQRFGLGRCGFGGGGRPARTGCASRRPSLLGRRDVPDARVSHGVAVLLEQRRPTRHGACALTACLRFLECCWRGPGLGSACTLPLSISITFSIDKIMDVICVLGRGNYGISSDSIRQSIVLLCNTGAGLIS